jgi:hypothetical protein
MYKIVKIMEEEHKEKQIWLEKRQALLNGPKCACFGPTDFVFMDDQVCLCLKCKLPCKFKPEEVGICTVTIEMKKSTRVFSEEELKIL